MFKIRYGLRQIEWMKWAPNSDILVALLTLAWMTFAYYTMHHTDSTLFIVCGFTLLTNGNLSSSTAGCNCASSAPLASCRVS